MLDFSFNPGENANGYRATVPPWEICNGKVSEITLSNGQLSEQDQLRRFKQYMQNTTQSVLAVATTDVYLANAGKNCHVDDVLTGHLFYTTHICPFWRNYSGSKLSYKLAESFCDVLRSIPLAYSKLLRQCQFEWSLNRPTPVPAATAGLFPLRSWMHMPKHTT